MSKKLVVRPAARAEVAEAALWYFERNKRAAREFVEAFEAGLIAINDNPLQYPEFVPTPLHF